MTHIATNSDLLESQCLRIGVISAFVLGGTGFWIDCFNSKISSDKNVIYLMAIYFVPHWLCYQMMCIVICQLNQDTKWNYMLCTLVCCVFYCNLIFSGLAVTYKYLYQLEYLFFQPILNFLAAAFLLLIILIKRSGNPISCVRHQSEQSIGTAGTAI